MLTPHARRTSRTRIQTRSSRSANETSYQSPRFGYTVTWTPPWDIAGSGAEDAINSVPGTDRVVICMQDCDAAEVQIVGVHRRDILDAVETARFWASAAYLSEFTPSGTKVVLSQGCSKTAALVMVSPGETAETAVVTVKASYDVQHNASVRVTFVADLATFHESFQSLQQNVLIDGRAPLGCFSSDVLLAVLP